MPWTQIKPRRNPPPMPAEGMSIYLHGDGTLTLGPRLFEAIRQPTHLLLAVDAERGLLGLRGAQPSDDAYGLFRPAPGQARCSVNAVRALRELGVPAEAAEGEHLPRQAEGFVVLDLSAFRTGPRP